MNNTDTTEQHDSVWSPLFQQRGFRALMNAFAFPGRRLALPHCADASGPTCIAAILCDNEVTLADPDQLIQPVDIRRLGIGIAETGQAGFIVADGRLPPDFNPNTGTLSEPEQGATVILSVDSLQDRTDFPLILRGPGIDGQQPLAIRGLHGDWLSARVRWNRNFPMGVDLILVDNSQVVALPRTTQISGGTD